MMNFKIRIDPNCIDWELLEQQKQQLKMFDEFSGIVNLINKLQTAYNIASTLIPIEDLDLEELNQIVK